MKSNAIWESLTDIREEFIEEAAPHRPQPAPITALSHRRRRFIRWGALAASIAILCALAFPWIRNILSPDETVADDAYAHYPVRNYSDYETRIPNLARIFTFRYSIDGESVQLMFPSVEWNGETYHLSNDNESFVSVSADEVGEVLWETQVTAYLVSDHSKSATLPATLFAHPDLDPSYGVVLTMEGVEGAFLYRSGKYADSLEELWEDAGFDRHLTVSGNIFHSTVDHKGNAVDLVFEGMTSEILWDELLSHGKTVDYDGKDGDYLRISIGHDLLQYPSVLCVTSDGYITLGALKAGKAVYVGKERARAFLDYLEDNLEGYRLVEKEESPSAPDIGNPATTAITRTSSANNPRVPE